MFSSRLAYREVSTAASARTAMSAGPTTRSRTAAESPTSVSMQMIMIVTSTLTVSISDLASTSVR